MDRMNAMDAGFYFAESARAPLHVAAVTILEGPVPAQPEIDRAVLRGLAAAPRYRRRVRTVPLNLGLPVWVDDPRFEVGYHLRRTAVPHPGGPDELRDLLGRVLGRRLDLSRPPWELWVIEGLGGGRWAIAAKMHHCAMGGACGDLITTLFEAGSAGGAVPVSWAAGAQPSPLALIACGLLDGLAPPARRLAGLPSLVRREVGGLHVPDPLSLALPRIHRLPSFPSLPSLPSLPGLGRPPAPPPAPAGHPRSDRPLHEVWNYTSGLPQLAENIAHHGVASLSAPLGAHRRWSWCDVDARTIGVVRRRLGGTADDVVLASVTRGFRDLLAARGELTGDTVVRALVPVSAGPAGAAGPGRTPSGRVSGLIVALPCGEPDPLRRLTLVSEQMEELRRTHQEIGIAALARIAGVSPPALSLVSRATRTMIRPMFQAIVAEVPDPGVPPRIMGRKVLSLYPYVPVAAGAGVSVGISSHRNRLFFGVTGDLDGAPDLEVLAAGITAGLAELRCLASAA